MSLVIGQARTTPETGMAARIWAAYLLRTAYAGVLPSALDAGGNAFRDALAAMYESIAAGVINGLLSDAQITVTVPTNAFGAGIPPAPVTLTCTIV